LAYPPNWRFLENLPLQDRIPKTSQWLTIPKNVEGSLLILTAKPTYRIIKSVRHKEIIMTHEEILASDKSNHNPKMSTVKS
jgi:hypothetical protein